MKSAHLAAVLAVALGIPALSAAPSAIGDISGDWTGTGSVRRDDKSRPINVNCTIVGQNAKPTELGFDGVCRAMLVMKRPIGATFVLDGDKVTGTYTGSEIGVAQLDGSAVSPTEWKLAMTFPRDVNGDNKAEMIIQNPGDGTFRILTTDKMVSGAVVTTTDVVFKKD